MLKRDLIKEAAAESGQTQEATRAVVEALEKVVLRTIAAGRSVMLLGLGKLVTSRRGEKKARNLHTGAAVVVPPRTVALLRPSDALTAAANGSV